MDIQKIQDIVNLVANSQVAEVALTQQDGSIRIKNNLQAAVLPRENLVPNASSSAQLAPNLSDEANSITLQSKHIGKLKLADDAISEPLVKVGDMVKEGDTIGYVAALAQLNPIIADKSGVVREILLAQNATVEYGTPIMHLKSN